MALSKFNYIFFFRLKCIFKMSDIFDYFVHNKDNDIFICQVKRDTPALLDDDNEPEQVCGAKIKGSTHNKSGSGNGSRLSNLRNHLKTKHKKTFEVFFIFH